MSKDKRILINKEDNRLRNLMLGGLLGISIVAVIQMIGISKAENLVLASLISFSIGIPFLTAEILVNYFELDYQYTYKVSNLRLLLFGIGSIGSVTGLIFIIMNLSLLAGFIFVLCIALAAFYFVRMSDLIEGLNK